MVDLRRVYYDGRGVYPDLAFHAAAMSYWVLQNDIPSNAAVATNQGLANVLYYQSANTLVPRLIAGFDGRGWQIAVSGTNTIQQWMKYISTTALVPATGLAGKVFQPFEEWSQDLYLAVRDLIGNSNYVTLMGHSLGGAMAILVGEKLSVLGKRVKAIATFGCPKVGDIDFFNACRVPTHNVRMLTDVIPYAPPASPLARYLSPPYGSFYPQLFRPGSDYVLVGNTQAVASLYELVGSAGPNLWFVQLSSRVIREHRIETYIRNLWRVLSSDDRKANRQWFNWLGDRGNLPLLPSLDL